MSEDRLDLDQVEALYKVAAGEYRECNNFTLLASMHPLIPALVARVRELEGERSKETIWMAQRIIDLEGTVAGLELLVKELSGG